MDFHKGRGGASSLPRVRLRPYPALATLALTTAFLPMALGHGGHDENKIPEGQTISLDPIVRRQNHDPEGWRH
jgi:hypothetical protein